MAWQARSPIPPGHHGSPLGHHEWTPERHRCGQIATDRSGFPGNPAMRGEGSRRRGQVWPCGGGSVRPMVPRPGGLRCGRRSGQGQGGSHGHHRRLPRGMSGLEAHRWNPSAGRFPWICRMSPSARARSRGLPVRIPAPSCQLSQPLPFRCVPAAVPLVPVTAARAPRGVRSRESRASQARPPRAVCRDRGVRAAETKGRTTA